MADSATPPKPPRTCPICGKPSVKPFDPFCSARCADVDLNRWLSGVYYIPADVQGEGEAPNLGIADEDEEET